MVAMKFVRWRKYGHDRLYLTADDGVRIGYLDLADHDTPHIDRPDRTTEFHAAIGSWRAAGRPDHHVDPGLSGIPAPRLRRVALRRQRHDSPPAIPTMPDPATAVSPADGWEDLALHRAGHGVADIAAAQRKAHPITARLDRLRGKHTDAQAWAKGAAGEQATAKALAWLTSGGTGQDWRVIHSITVNEHGGDIDHLLIGPAGVFTINTKNHPGKTVHVGARTLTINGYNHYDYIRHAHNEAERAQNRLADAGVTCDVWPIICFVNATLTGEQQLDGVLCIEAPRLGIAMANYGTTNPTLPAAGINHIHAVARRSTTWLPTGP
jgi:hypothetical protein